MFPNLSVPWRLMLMSGTMHAMFFIPVALAYYQLKGADFAGFLLLQGLFRVAILVMEIPTGYLADRWNRHTQILVASVLWFASMSLLFMADDYMGLLIAELVGAVSIALNSGTLQAYLHEALAQKGQAKMQATWQGRLFAASTGAEVLAGLVGGWLFTQWVEAPVVATMLCTLVAVLVACSLPNIPRSKAQRRHHNPMADLWLVVHHSLRIHPRLPWLLLGPWVVFGLTSIVFWAMQAKLMALGLSPVMLGVVLATYQGSKTLLSLCVGWLEKLPLAGLMAGMVALLTGGTLLVLTANPALIWLGGILAAGVVHAVGRPLATTLINAEVPDHERATVLSVASMVSQLMGAVLMVVATPLLGVMNLDQLLAAYMAVTLLVAGYPLWRIVRG